MLPQITSDYLKLPIQGGTPEDQAQACEWQAMFLTSADKTQNHGLRPLSALSLQALKRFSVSVFWFQRFPSSLRNFFLSIPQSPS